MDIFIVTFIKMLYIEFKLLDFHTSHWIVEFDITRIILVINVIYYKRYAVILVESNFTAFAIHLPNSGILCDSTFNIFDLFDDIEIFFITSSIHMHS